MTTIVNAAAALALVNHFLEVAAAEPTTFRDHGGVEKGWSRTEKARIALQRAARADRLYGHFANEVTK